LRASTSNKNNYGTATFTSEYCQASMSINMETVFDIQPIAAISKRNFKKRHVNLTGFLVLELPGNSAAVIPVMQIKNQL
jgi:hypothetical protein